MKVAVVTPYYKEDLEILRCCHESVAAQSYPCSHLMIADGHPQVAVAAWPVQHIVLPRAHGDNGNTPRAIGSLTVNTQGFDALAYLDADNWYYPGYIETMVTLQQTTGAVVCTAGRSMHRLDGSLMYLDRNESDGKRHVDTSCLFLTRQAFRLTPLWAMMPKQLGPTCDRVFWEAIRSRRLAHAHNPAPTVAFRSYYAVHYRNIGETPPPGAKTVAENAGAARRWWNGLPVPEREDWQRYFATGQW